MDYKAHPPIPTNMPPVAGALTWCRGLLSRLKGPTEKLRSLDRKVLDRDEGVSGLVQRYGG